MIDAIAYVGRSFYEVVLKDGQFITILKGLRTTVLISAIGLLIGVVIGAALCAMSLSRYRALRAVDRAYTLIVRGTPVLLILMLFYYVVFAKMRMDALYVAYVAFGIHSGAHMGEIMKSAMSAVDRGQISAARTLGFSKVGAFTYVTFPQAARIAKPVLQNTIISTIQWTSVVGYITITDLTRTVNNMGARTAQPFFALFVGIVLYLLLAYVTHLLFALSNRRGARRA